MGLSVDEINEKYAKQRGHCLRNTLLPYECDWTCPSCNHNVRKTKHELSKIQRNKINFISSINYAEHKIFCICIDVYKIYEDNDYEEIYEVLSTLKNKKLKINKTLIEKYKDMIVNEDSEQNYYS